MKSAAMDRLAAANPVMALPAVAPAEHLRGLIEHETPQTGAPGRAPGARARHRRGAFAATVLLCVAIATAGAFLSGSSPGPALNVAAAAYAATGPRPGVIEGVWITRVLRGAQRGSVLRQREWLDATHSRRRESDVIRSPTQSAQRSDWVLAPGRQEYWGTPTEGPANGPPQVRRVLRMTNADLMVHAAFGGIELAGLEAVELYRTLYRRGEMRLVGRVRQGGRALWKLESHPSPVVAREDHTRLIVFVDPKSFLPVTERAIETAEPGRPAIVESNLVSYRAFEPRQVPKGLFDLATAHPRSQLFVTHAKPVLRRQRR
jgi:hypothetical protein